MAVYPRNKAGIELEYVIGTTANLNAMANNSIKSTH
jgi:hypothetical protein